MTGKWQGFQHFVCFFFGCGPDSQKAAPLFRIRRREGVFKNEAFPAQLRQTCFLLRYLCQKRLVRHLFPVHHHLKPLLCVRSELRKIGQWRQLMGNLSKYVLQPLFQQFQIGRTFGVRNTRRTPGNEWVEWEKSVKPEDAVVDGSKDGTERSMNALS